MFLFPITNDRTILFGGGRGGSFLSCLATASQGGLPRQAQTCPKTLKEVTELLSATWAWRAHTGSQQGPELKPAQLPSMALSLIQWDKSVDSRDCEQQRWCEHSSLAQLTPVSLHQFSLIPTAPKQGWAESHGEWLSLDFLLSPSCVKKGRWGKELLGKYLASIMSEALGFIPSSPKNKVQLLERTELTDPSIFPESRRKARGRQRVLACWLSGQAGGQAGEQASKQASEQHALPSPWAPLLATIPHVACFYSVLRSSILWLCVWFAFLFYFGLNEKTK